MQTVIIVVHLFIVLALIGVVLLQRSEGGLGLGGGGGGGGGFMTGRGQANALTRATAILAALFFLTSIVLAWDRRKRSRSAAPDAGWRSGRHASSRARARDAAGAAVALI
jgi:preprotein translocase subunit SecG